MIVSGFKVSPPVVLFYQHIIYSLLYLAALMLRRVSVKEVLRKSAGQFPLIGTVALLTIAYRFTQLEATVLAPVALVLAVKRTSILYASFFGGKIFSEERLATKLLGALLIVTAGFCILRNAG